MTSKLLKNLFLSSEESRNLAEFLAQKKEVLGVMKTCEIMNYHALLRRQKTKIRQE